MDNLPPVPKQNTDENSGRYRAYKFSAVLSEVQTGKSNQYQANEYVSYQRARRKDAEPITSEEITVIGF